MNNKFMKSEQSELQIDGKSTAYVMINCKHGYESEVLEKLGNIKEAKEVVQTFGSYDILAKIESLTVDRIRDIIAWKIRKMDKIHSTTTLVRINP
jgi:DNA-binding Lrp family transcriptional regulator